MEPLKKKCIPKPGLIIHNEYSKAWAVDVAMLLLPRLTSCCQGVEPSRWYVFASFTT